MTQLLRHLPGVLMCIILAATATATSAAKHASRQFPQLAAFCERAKHGEHVTVAFLGGSITWGATATDPLKTSYRALVTRFLEDRYPKAHVRAVDAAIGGIGSELGVFRMDRDVLPYHPDLTFVEFAVNDWGASNSQETMEGIIRKLRRANPEMAIVILIIGSNYDYSRSPAGDLHRQLAAHYGLPCINIDNAVLAKVQAGLDIHTMLTDGCHPNDTGYQLYATIITEEFVRLAEATGASIATLPAPLTENRYERAHMLELAKLTDLGVWQAAVPSVTGTWFDHQPSRWLSSVVVPTTDHAPLHLNLACSGVGLYYEIHRDGHPLHLSEGETRILDIDTSMPFDYARIAYQFQFLGEKKDRQLMLTADRKENTRVGYLLYTD